MERATTTGARHVPHNMPLVVDGNTTTTMTMTAFANALGALWCLLPTLRLSISSIYHIDRECHSKNRGCSCCCCCCMCFLLFPYHYVQGALFLAKRSNSRSNRGLGTRCTRIIRQRRCDSDHQPASRRYMRTLNAGRTEETQLYRTFSLHALRYTISHRIAPHRRHAKHIEYLFLFVSPLHL